VRDLRPLFDPRSVAVVGASSDPVKWGYWLARGAVRGEHRRAVYLVSRSGGEVLGRPVYRSVGELPEPPELVVLSVPAQALETAVDESLAAGARALVAITAGLGEQGGDGLRRERAIVERVRAAGAVLVGPNCLGVFDADAELELASEELASGPVALVSQSGNVALEIGLLLADVGLGFSRFVSAGNQADLDAAELVASLAAHEPTRVIAAYCEDFRDGRAFAAAARSAGKPVVLLTVGRTEAAVRAARSHTGALTSDLDVVAAACRSAGIHLVQTPRELVDLAQALIAAPRPRGRRVAIVGDGGGYGAIACDLCGAHALELPVLAEETQEALRGVLPPTAATANPVDLAGAGEQDTFSFARSTRILLEAPEVDAVLFTAYYGGYSGQSEELRDRELGVARSLVQAVAETGCTLVVHTMYWDSPPARALRAAGVPVYRAAESAVFSLARLVDGAPPTPLPALPPAASPLTETDYGSARKALASAGIPFAAARIVPPDGAAAAADAVGYPLVVKALGALHKSDAGGVVVGLRNREELEAAVVRLAAVELSVEHAEDVAAGFELIVGARRDARFGPVVLVGAGGIHAELLADTAVALAPVGADEARRLVLSLRCAPLLTGARGRPVLDVDAAASAVAALSRFAAEHPEIAEVEVNPLLVRREGAVGLDARVVLA
jgi:acyl-CoA synthetase (NDP forming)